MSAVPTQPVNPLLRDGLATWDHLLSQGMSALPNGAFIPLAVAVLILAFVLTALLCQWSLWRRYRRGASLLRKIRDNVKGKKSFEEVLRVVQDVAGTRPCGAAKLLVGYIERAPRRGSEFRPVTAVAGENEREKRLLRVALVRWVAGAALVMGLTGTFVAFTQLITGSGLLEALSSLHNAPQSAETSPEVMNSYAQLTAAFTRVYEGFGYAFLASLAGLVGTILLGFVNAIFVARALGLCLEEMVDFGEEILSPRLAPPASRADDFSAALTSAAAVLGTSAEAMVSLRGTSNVLDRAAQRFEQSQGANSEMVTTLTKLAGEIETSRQRWDVLLEALRESRLSMGRSVEEFRKEAAAQRELTNASTAATLTGMREIVTAMATEIQKVSAAKADEFTAVQSGVQRMLVESKKDWDKVSTALIAKTDEGFKLSLQTVQSIIQNSRDDAATAQRETAELVREVAAVVTTHRQALTVQAQAVTASLQQWGETPAALTAAVQVWGEASEKLTSTLSAVSEMPARWEDRVLNPLKQLGAKLDQATARAERESWMSRCWSKVRGWFLQRERQE